MVRKSSGKPHDPVSHRSSTFSVFWTRSFNVPRSTCLRTWPEDRQMVTVKNTAGVSDYCSIVLNDERLDLRAIALVLYHIVRAFSSPDVYLNG